MPVSLRPKRHPGRFPRSEIAAQCSPCAPLTDHAKIEVASISRKGNLIVVSLRAHRSRTDEMRGPLLQIELSGIHTSMLSRYRVEIQVSFPRIEVPISSDDASNRVLQAQSLHGERPASGRLKKSGRSLLWQLVFPTIYRTADDRTEVLRLKAEVNARTGELLRYHTADIARPIGEGDILAWLDEQSILVHRPGKGLSLLMIPSSTNIPIRGLKSDSKTAFGDPYHPRAILLDAATETVVQIGTDGSTKSLPSPKGASLSAITFDHDGSIYALSVHHGKSLWLLRDDHPQKISDLPASVRAISVC